MCYGSSRGVYGWNAARLLPFTLYPRALALPQFGADPNVNYDSMNSVSDRECAATAEPGCGCAQNGLAPGSDGAGETAGDFGVLCGVLEPALEPCRADGM